MGKIAILNETKQEICKYKKEHPLLKQNEIAEIFSKNYNRKFNKSSISEILKNSELYLNKDFSLQIHSSLKTQQSKISSFFK